MEIQNTDKSSANNTPKDVSLASGPEVFHDLSLPFEAPAKDFVTGPYYVDADEVVPGLKTEDTPSSQETTSQLPVDRRDFMRLFSAGSVLASTACIRRPIERAIPHVKQPIDQVLGTPTYYATTCGECTAGCGIVVKTKEGRPTKIEGNPENPISQGGSCALGQSALQGLYHPERRKKPRVLRGNRWDDADWTEWIEILGSRLSGAKNVGILTGGTTGSQHGFYKSFLQKLGMPESNLFTYESNTLIEATVAAHRIAFGVEAMPRPEYRKSEYIVGVGSDFLEVGLSPTYSAKSFSESHSFKFGKMGKFVQFESALTQTGARADERHVIPAGHEGWVSLLLARHLLAHSESKGSAAERAEIKSVLDAYESELDGLYGSLGINAVRFDEIAAELIAKSSIFVAGSSYSFDENATNLQLTAIMVNTLCGAYGETLFIDRGWMVSPIKAGDTKRFLDKASELDALIVINSNPAFTMPASWGVDAILKGIPLVVSIQPMPNETDTYASFVGNGHHFLESWGDEQPVAGFWSARQPTVRPAFGSMQAEDVLLWVAAAMERPMGYREYREYLREQWRAVHRALAAQVDFDTFFDAVLRRGFSGKLDRQGVRSMSGVAAQLKMQGPQGGDTVLLSNLDVRLRDGIGADRPILQEVGDSITSITWGTWVAMNPNRAVKEGLKRHDVVRVTSPSGSFEAPVYPLPGLHHNTIVVPRGNGHRSGLSKVTDGIGVDPLVAYERRADVITGAPVTSVQSVTIEKTGRKQLMALLQRHNDLANRRDIVKTVSLSKATANMGNTKDLDTVPDLYPKLDEGVQYRWGMSIDLTACTGCSACMVACASENNVPTIGPDQVIRGREMHWIRLDRYFSGDVNNPELTFQPMMCQHCNHAPCEGVCPVYATSHDEEGLNNQTYNRCVGTRYCANACPYKVRRFNWFTHKWNINGDLPKDRNPRALNPDVTIRTRGVMEKCSFCYQRIRDAKHAAKEQNTQVSDSMLQTACQQACPSNAIVFGDLKNSRSAVAKLRQDNRAYLVLGGDPEHGHYGTKTLPNVSYLAKVTHHEPQGAGHHDDHHDEHHN